MQVKLVVTGEYDISKIKDLNLTDSSMGTLTFSEDIADSDQFAIYVDKLEELHEVFNGEIIASEISFYGEGDLSIDNDILQKLVKLNTTLKLKIKPNIIQAQAVLKPAFFKKK